MSPLLPTDAKERKKIPLWSGLMQYFPLTMIEVAKLSYVGNQQHNPGESLHWAREKSSDQEDTMLRHFMEKGTIDTDGIRHIIKATWRCMATAELELEAARKETMGSCGKIGTSCICTSTSHQQILCDPRRIK